MNKGRLEAFTDGVIAIIITIAVLEMKIPAGGRLADLAAQAPILGVYALSFLQVGIFWNNHHHILQATKTVNGAVLLANLFLLFWMSLIPFAIRWMDEDSFQSLPVAAYGVVFTLSGVGYILLERTIIAADPANHLLKSAVGVDRKTLVSLGLDVVAIGIAFVRPWLAIAIFVFIAVLWLVPDRRVESRLQA